MDGETCDQHFDKYGGSIFDGVTYWAFQAVKGMHAKFNELNRRLTKATLINDLKITEIINDFGGGDDGTSSTFATISAAFTMANGMAAAVPGVVRPAPSRVHTPPSLQRICSSWKVM